MKSAIPPAKLRLLRPKPLDKRHSEDTGSCIGQKTEGGQVQIPSNMGRRLVVAVFGLAVFIQFVALEQIALPS